jgi:hypothetical protein
MSSKVDAINFLPATEKTAHFHKLLWCHSFTSKDIGFLKVGVDLFKSDTTVVISVTGNMTLEEMVLDCDVFGSRGHLDGPGGCKSSVVIFKYGGFNDGAVESGKFHCINNFRQESTKG